MSGPHDRERRERIARKKTATLPRPVRTRNAAPCLACTTPLLWGQMARMSRNRTRRRAASALTVCAIGAALLEVRAQTISVRLLSYTPEVITPSRTQPVLIEAEVQGRPTSATVEFNPRGTTNTAIMMRDDGTNGDRVAGDSTYSALLPAGRS